MNVHKPSRSSVIGTGTLAATLLLTVCGTAGAQTPPTAVDKATTATAAADPRSAPPRCTADDLAATVQLQNTGSAKNTGSAMVMLQNKGSRTCTLRGYPGFAGLLANNRSDTLAVKRLPHPGPPTRVTLKPGATAFAGLKWTTCQKSNKNCHVIAGLRLTPPDGNRQLTAKVVGLNGQAVTRLTVSAAGLTTGTLQSTSQGVVFAPGS
ncbi:DUF4232 domain-containing protein [Kitasatospora aureofaciens]|uniref:DUF4232 domain-containing protein n=1 Tax=Kitasatospora aureofaciens TaxID=1894 RepID=UPI001E194436|nr:DUF4232 domain-containing protein [Kitasatospora aureofaciens]HJD82316.1 DUF4232 domain-containing protein [Kitasatospora aureofaciens]